MEITNRETSVEVLHYADNISLDVWSNTGSGEVISARLTPEQALMIAAALQKAAMLEIKL